MKKHLARLASVSLLLSLVPEANAAVPQNVISADARRIGYADLNAMRSSTLGKQIIDALRVEQLGATDGLIALNIAKVLETIGSITVYGTNTSTQSQDMDGALLVQGTPNLKKIAEGLLLQGTINDPNDLTITELKDFPFPAYGLKGKSGKEAQCGQLIVAFPPEPVVLLSKSKAQITKALEVFRGTAPSLEKTPNPALLQLLAGSENAYALLGSLTLSNKTPQKKNPATRLLQLANAGMIAVGEKGENTFAHVSLTANTEDSAGKLLKIAQGMSAMLSLGESDDIQLSELLNSIAVEKQNDIVTLDLAYSSARLSQMLQALQQRQSQKAKPQKESKADISFSFSFGDKKKKSTPEKDTAQPAEAAGATEK